MSVQNEIEVGTVVHTPEQFAALPADTICVGTDAARHHNNSRGMVQQMWAGWLPAMVIALPQPAEPEWVEAAARQARAAFMSRDTWEGLGDSERREWRDIARAAVAAADKARGIINSREEFDALPVGARVIGKSKRGGWYDGTVTASYVPDDLSFPLLVVVYGGAA